MPELANCETAERPALIDQIIEGREEGITFAQATRHPALQRDRRPAPLCVLYRYADRGVRGVRLESARVGGRRVTTAEAVGRFVRRLNEPATAQGETLRRPRPSPLAAAGRDRRAHATAVGELRAAGLM